jgi:hypothetical protein
VSSNASHIFIISPESVTIREDGCFLETVLLFLLSLRERTDKWEERQEMRHKILRDKGHETREDRRIRKNKTQETVDGKGEMRG